MQKLQSSQHHLTAIHALFAEVGASQSDCMVQPMKKKWQEKQALDPPVQNATDPDLSHPFNRNRCVCFLEAIGLRCASLRRQFTTLTRRYVHAACRIPSAPAAMASNPLILLFDNLSRCCRACAVQMSSATSSSQACCLSVTSSLERRSGPFIRPFYTLPTQHPPLLSKRTSGTPCYAF